MSFEIVSIDQLSNESDVEQKFLFPFLTAENPYGLGIEPISIQTKSNIRRFTIGKGSDQKSYFPDYIITLGGIPLLVCEGKSPGADLSEAFRKARLYSAELNAVLPTNINPISRIIATDGTRILAGNCDHNVPRFEISAAEINVYSEKMANFISDFGIIALQKAYKDIIPRIRPRRFWKPGQLVGGLSVQNEEVAINSFGATITTDFSHIFNPVNFEDRANIARHAYVSSKRRERYIEPIDRIIRASVPVSEAHSKTIDDTSSPKEIFRALRRHKRLEHQILLIVGSAGSGKTTFVDRIQDVALPNDLKNKTFWIRINMNPAPISRAEIYDWLRREIISACRASNKSFDFDDLNSLIEINKRQVEVFRKGIGRLYEKKIRLHTMKNWRLILSL